MSTAFLVQGEKFHMPEFPSKQTVPVIHKYMQARPELTELMILLDKTKPQTFSWPFASGSLHYCFLPAITLSFLSLVSQHWYASKRWADYPSLSFHSSRCLSDMLWLQLSRVKRPEPKKKTPKSPLRPSALRSSSTETGCLVSEHASSTDFCLVFKAYPKTVLRYAGPKAGEDSVLSEMKSWMAEKQERCFPWWGEKDEREVLPWFWLQTIFIHAN